MATRTEPATTGTLSIGDQWNAITIIAHSQTHPLKAICELTENAIDAGARSVRIVRRRRRGEIFLEFEDDGRGVAPDAAGRPDFARIATHLCDSMKRRLDAEHRRGVHGEFGIGLLSFWSLGEELRMTSAGSDGRAEELRLVRGRREYEIRPVAGLLSASGTRVVVGPLLEATRNLVTGEKIARYLSAELRDRIRNTGVRLVVADLLARGKGEREILVTPREFEGERLDIPRRYATPLGDVQVEVYVRGDGAAPAGGIALFKDGTRVLPRIAELLAFQQAPWTDGRLEGLLDYEPLALAPGTRNGVVVDGALESLVAAATTIGRDITAALAARDEAETERASRQILKQVHKAFVTALWELPAEDYLYFDIPKPAAEAEPDDADAAAGRGQTKLFAGDPGPLAAVRVSPRHPRVVPGGEIRLVATPRDAEGNPLGGRASLHWRLAGGTAWLAADGAGCLVRSDTPGIATVEVVARHGDAEVADSVAIKFLLEAEAAAGGSRKSRGLPSYRLEAEHGRSWRSRYEPAGNEIVINSAHRDFLASRSSAARHRRYIGKLYAKEVVLSNFPDESPAEALERLIELTLRTEDAL
ncbi:MAG: ATP-binding protein [Planctomycetota bacterium]